MAEEDMRAEFERIAQWRTSEKSGWSSAPVTGRMEAAARGETDAEVFTFGPGLITYPAARELLAALSHVDKGDAVFLDFGCANGVVAAILAATESTRGWGYIGVDVNGALIEACRRRFPQHAFHQVKEGHSLPLRDASVDVVLASGVIETIADTQTILRELARVTRSWLLLYRVPCRDEQTEALYWQKVYHSWGVEEHAFHVFNEGHLAEMIHAAGLRIVSREVSPASGEWLPPDDSTPVKHFLYVLRKEATH